LGLQLRQEFDRGGEVAALLADVGVRIRLGREVADAGKDLATLITNGQGRRPSQLAF
jgi:hypothetical protein